MERDLLGKLAGVLTIIGAFLIPILAMYFKYKGRKLRHAERLAYIEKGLPIPAELEEKKKSIEETKRHLLIGGLITLFAGIGIFGYFYLSADLKTASQFGFVFIAIGIGLLLSSLLIKEKKQREKNSFKK